MKLAPLDNPVRASWLTEQGIRFDPGPYVSEAYQARKFIDSLPKVERLSQVTERIFHPGIFRRKWVTDPEIGKPFLGSAAIFQNDLSNLPLIGGIPSQKESNFALKPGWTLITRSGMTAGRVTYSRLEADGFACSEHVMRVIPQRELISPGYLYTFLASKYGRPIIKGSIYGTSVRHIEADHIDNMPIPRMASDIEEAIDSLFNEAMRLRSLFQRRITEATEDLFKSANLPDLLNLNWHTQAREIGFAARRVNATTLRALNHSPRANEVAEAIRVRSHLPLGDICNGGMLASGVRFKRVDAQPENGGVRLVGQRHGFWMRPEGRWISPKRAPSGIFAPDEAVLVSAQGSPGETDTLGRAIFVTGSWTKNAYTQHFLRVVSGDSSVSGAYLFAFLRSEAAFRMLRATCVGSIQQDLHARLRREIPVPLCTPEDRQRISETVRQAYRWRDEADMKEDEAFTLLDAAVREAAR